MCNLCLTILQFAPRFKCSKCFGFKGTFEILRLMQIEYYATASSQLKTKFETILRFLRYALKPSQ